MVLEAIQSLLHKYNCVIVPGFGGIITNYSSAEIHLVKNTFTPPKKRLAFNENLVESDGLLVNHVRVHAGVSIEEAEKEVAQFVSRIKTTMEQEGNIMLDHVGMFSFNSEKRIQFKPLITENYLEDSFGLPELYFKPIERTETTTMQEVHSTPKPPAPNRGPVKKEEQEAAPKKSNKVFLIIPIVLILALAGSMFIKKDGQMLAASFIPSLKSSVAEAEEEVVEDAEESEDYANEDAEEGYAEDESDDYAHEVEAHDDDWHASDDHSSAGAYHVIAGVFSKRSYAQRLADKYHGEVLELDGYYKVSVSRSSSKEEADSEKANLVSELGNDIWILEE